MDTITITRIQAAQILETLDALGLALAGDKDLSLPLGSKYERAAKVLAHALRKQKPK